MNRKFHITTLGAAAAFAVLTSAVLTTSQPAWAQGIPQPLQCGLGLATPPAWHTSNGGPDVCFP